VFLVVCRSRICFLLNKFEEPVDGAQRALNIALPSDLRKLPIYHNLTHIGDYERSVRYLTKGWFELFSYP
jgi:hypothetical protein